MAETIIMDNGSYTLKVGLGGEDAPRSMERVSHYYRNPTTPVIEKGIIADWEQVLKLWNIDDLKDSPVLLTQSPLNTTEARRKSIEILFEKNGVSSLYLAYQPILALYANGKFTGTVLDVGYHCTHASVVSEGSLLKDTVTRTDVGGATLSNLYNDLLVTKFESDAPSVTAGQAAERVEAIKRSLSFVADLTKGSEGKSLYNTPDSFELPDGAVIKTNDGFACGVPEVLFNPSSIGSETPANGIQHALRQTLEKAQSVEALPDIRSSIVLVGATTLLKGLPERMNEEVKRFGGPQTYDVEAPDDRRYSTWVGGSILTNINTDMFVSKASYDEYGADVVDTMMGS